eukprot:6197761-Pleurochrysis_carterae.AAC.1
MHPRPHTCTHAHASTRSGTHAIRRPIRTHARHTHTRKLAFLVHAHTHARPHSRASARRRRVGGRRGHGAGALGVSSGEASSSSDLGGSSKYSNQMGTF